MTAPDPGLTDLIAAHRLHTGLQTQCECGINVSHEDWAAHVALVVEQHTNGRTAELGWDELVAAIPDGWELQESAQLEEVSRVRQRDLEASQATTARWRARAEKAEAELEKYHAEERRELEWDRFCAQQDVRCTECGLRYGERKDYTCPHIGEHKYDADELRAALEGEQQ